MWRKHGGSFLTLASYKTEGWTDLFNLIHPVLLQRADRTRTNTEFLGRETLICINEYGTRSFQENNRLPRSPDHFEHTLSILWNMSVFFKKMKFLQHRGGWTRMISAKPSDYESDNLLSGHNLWSLPWPYSPFTCSVIPLNPWPFHLLLVYRPAPGFAFFLGWSFQLTSTLHFSFCLSGSANFQLWINCSYSLFLEGGWEAQGNEVTQQGKLVSPRTPGL